MHKSSIDVILTNRPRSFQYSLTTETGLSDHHKMITTFMRSNFVRLQPKQISYRNFKTFNESLFLADVQNIDFNCHSDNADVIYDSLADNFQKSLINMLLLNKNLYEITRHLS